MQVTVNSTTFSLLSAHAATEELKGFRRDVISLTIEATYAEAALLRKRIEDLEQWQKDSKKFHHDFYDWQRTQIARDATLDEKLNNMDANIKKVLEKQEACELKPGKRWDVNSYGNYNSWNANDSYGVRPALVLPSDFRI